MTHNTERPTPAELAEQRWNQLAKEVADFVAEHGKFPARTCYAGSWLNTQRSGYRARGRLMNNRHLRLDELIPGWSSRRASSWPQRARDLGNFVADRGHMPNPRSTENTERSLGRWAEDQRFALRDGKLSTAQTRTLDKVAPEWRTKLIDRRWHARLDAVASFIDEHGQLPNRADDRSSAMWVENQVANLPPSGRTDREAAAFDKVPELSGGIAESKWMTRALAVAEFQKRNGRLPSRNIGPADERVLGLWLHNQRIRLKDQNARTRSRAVVLDALLGVWRWASQRKDAA